MLKRLLRYLLGDEEAPVRAPAPPDLPGVAQIDAIRVILPELPSVYTGEYVVSSESAAGVRRRWGGGRTEILHARMFPLT